MNILNDSGLVNLNTTLNLKTHFAKEYIESFITKQTTFPSIKNITENQKIISELRNLDETRLRNINTCVETLVQNEKELQFFFDKNNSLETLEKDTFGQLLFQHYDLKIFNTYPFLIMILSYIKIYFVPLISVTIPFIMYFLPYLLIKYVWNLPMTYEMYQNIMGQMISFSFDGSIEKLLQNAFTLFTICQSMYQPIQNALHLSTINNTSYLYIVSYELSKFETLLSIANSKRFIKVELYQSETPYLNIKNCVDINLNEANCVGSDFKIDTNSNHFLLSGPNGGGKSSFLRALLQSVLFSQSFGYAIGESAEMCVFDYIFSGLHIQDIPGEKSLFEKEVCFARDVLCFSDPKYKGLVLFDEIFHSTNPPDGIKTANKFLEKLYTYKHISSIISTHVFEIIESAPEFVKRICVNAHIQDETLIYDYKLSNGICKTSSVSDIWKKIYAE